MRIYKGLSISSVHWCFAWLFALTSPGGLYAQPVVDGARQENERLLKKVNERERSFLGRVVELTDDQKRQADEAGKEIRDKLLKNPNPPQLGVGAVPIVRFNNNGVTIQRSGLVKYSKDLQKEYAALLDEKQKTAYQSEIDARDEFIRNANAECLLILLDQRVSLQPEQVKPLKESLSKWEGADDFMLSFYFQNGSNSYFPPIPNQLYQKILNQDQLKIIRNLQQVYAQRQGGADEQFSW